MRLAGLADALDDRDHPRLVGLGDELVERADRLPVLLGLVEDRRDREAERGQDDRRAGDAADRLAGDREDLAAGHRLALEVADRLHLGELVGTAFAGRSGRLVFA